MNTFYRYWLTALLIKLIVSATLPFSSDEAYYWVWSNHLQLGYLDHPAMIAWLNYLGHPLDSFGLRWPAVIVGHLSWIAWYEILKNQIGSKTKIWCWLMLLNPLLGWGTFLSIPDTPAIFFSSLATLAAIRWVSKQTWTWALVLGAALGLGFNAKYHIVLFVPCLLLWIAWIKAWKKINWLQVGGIFVAGFVFCLPVLVWNSQNHFASFLFQLSHGLNAEKPRAVWPLEYLGSQVGLLFPTIFLLALKIPENNEKKFFYILGWFPIVFFLWTSFSARPEGNWPILGYAPLITLAVLQSKNLKWLQWTAGIWSVAFVLSMSEAYFQWLPIADKQNLKTSEATRFDEFIPWLNSDLPVYASSFQMAATLNFKTRKPIYKLRTLSRIDAYDYFDGSAPPPQGAFMVLANRETDFSQTILKNYKFVEEKHFTPEKKIMIYSGPPTESSR